MDMNRHCKCAIIINLNFLQVVNPPDDSIQCMAFSPASISQDFLVAGSWDNNVSSLIHESRLIRMEILLDIIAC